jgi:hypothetical protein
MADISTLSPMRVARHVVGLAALSVALALPASASAQSGDPAEGSPSGVIYEIPLDNARKDAAPTRKTSGGQGGGTVSPIRSENGFGSSSTVPGAASEAVAATAAGSGKPKSKKSKSGASGSGRPGSGGSGGSGGEGTGGAAAPSTSTQSINGAGTAAVTPSKSRAYLLLVLALAVAAGLGIAGRYVARRR